MRLNTNSMKIFKNKNSGFIKMTLVIISALVALKYIYDVDVIGFLTQGRFEELLDKFRDLGLKGWEKYKDLIIKVWGMISGFVKDFFADKIK